MRNLLRQRTIQNIKRSGWRAYAVIFMMTVTYVILGILLAVVFTSQSLARYFVQKPEVIGFFKDEVAEEKILEVKRDLEQKEFVSEVRYVSKEEAMESFIAENQDNRDIIEAVTVNVFPAHLNVKSTSLDKIPEIANFFRDSELISDVLAYEDVLGTLRRIVLGIQVFGFSLLMIFTISTILIIFLTIGITVHSRKDEIIIMKLVGATDSYVRAPYLLQSIFYSVAAILISSLILVPLLLLQYRNAIPLLVGDLDVAKLDFPIIALGVAVELVFGLLLSFFSSYFATRRYIGS